MKFLFTSKSLFVYTLLLVAGGMAFAIYLQFFQGQEPCSLCVFQRLSYIIYGFIVITALIHHPQYWGMRVYAFLSFWPALVGFSVALRQVWIQSLPAGSVPACGPGLNFLLEQFSVSHVVQIVWAGSSDCATVTWRLLGLSMAWWSAFVFLFLMVVNLVILFRKNQVEES